MLSELRRTDTRVLRALTFCESGLSQHALATQTGLAVNTTRAVIQRLGGRGLLRTTRHGAVVHSRIMPEHPQTRWLREAFRKEASWASARRTAGADLAATLRAVDDLNAFVCAFKDRNR